MDKIMIHDLALMCRIGCSAEERAFPQKMRIDLDVFLDTTDSAASGDIEDTICYHQVKSMLKEIASERDWVLVEELGTRMAGDIFKNYPRAESVRIELRKFVADDCAWMGAELHRSREV